ncbi:MAG: hypothetical protein FWD71_06205 [Oscillospiraceae bacterium]|nr:hypothetical protein [Oscillospiraceae bacterium]
MPMSQFKDNVDKPNQFLLNKAKEQADGIGFLAYLYKVIDTYDDEMNADWNNWEFPSKVKYSEFLGELMKQASPKPYLSTWMKETIYDAAIALGSDYESFKQLERISEI